MTSRFPPRFVLSPVCHHHILPAFFMSLFLLFSQVCFCYFLRSVSAIFSGLFLLFSRVCFCSHDTVSALFKILFLLFLRVCFYASVSAIFTYLLLLFAQVCFCYNHGTVSAIYTGLLRVVITNPALNSDLSCRDSVHILQILLIGPHPIRGQLVSENFAYPS